jgi:hypothetical protein
MPKLARYAPQTIPPLVSRLTPTDACHSSGNLSWYPVLSFFLDTFFLDTFFLNAFLKIRFSRSTSWKRLFERRVHGML